MRENCTAIIYIFSLRIVKSLQLRGRRQIVELRKYCLVCMIIFLWCIFFLFLHLTCLGISYIFPSLRRTKTIVITL